MYYLVDGDNLFLWITFGIHEFLFLQQCWFTMITCSCSFTFHAISLSNLLEAMTNMANDLYNQIGNNCPSKINSKTLSTFIASRNGYKIEILLDEYQRLALITEQYNKFASYKTFFLHACGYCQFVADVFLAAQVLKLPGTNVLDIWYIHFIHFLRNFSLNFSYDIFVFNNRFYIEDSLASMYMIYRVYKFMSQVQLNSQEFLRSVKLFLKFSYSDRGRLRRRIKALNITSLKLGPCHVTRRTVLAAMDMLCNYYICVALWK